MPEVLRMPERPTWKQRGRRVKKGPRVFTLAEVIGWAAMGCMIGVALGALIATAS